MYMLSDKPLISAKQIEMRLDEISGQVQEFRPDLILSALTGSFMFTADLSRRLARSDLQIQFIKTSSYGNSTESNGNVSIEGIDHLDLKGKKVLLVDDILDSGRTLYCLVQVLQKLGASSIKTCVLLNKEERRIVDIHADYVGFEIGNEFIVGYGLDYANNYRTYPDIWTLKDDHGK